MANTFLTAWITIRDAIISDWHVRFNRKDYEALGAEWNISAGTAHRIIHDNHVPQARVIHQVLIEAARKKGLLPYPKQRVRIDLPGDADPKIVEMIRTELTAAERLSALKQGLVMKDYSRERY